MVIGIKRKLNFYNHGIKGITHGRDLHNGGIVFVILVARNMNSHNYHEKRKTNKQNKTKLWYETRKK